MSEKTRIAVLGGGVSSLTAIYQLTLTPGWEDRYDISVYQLGWRLGGKCASSRRETADGRLENLEHGLHVLGGFYHNTFQILRELYADWQTLAPANAIPFEDAFLDLAEFDLMRRTKKGQWRKVRVKFPVTDGEPGINLPKLSVGEMFRRLIEWLRNIVLSTASFLDWGLIYDKFNSLRRNKKDDDSGESFGLSSGAGAMVEVMDELLTSFTKIMPPNNDAELEDMLVRGASQLVEATESVIERLIEEEGDEGDEDLDFDVMHMAGAGDRSEAPNWFRMFQIGMIFVRGAIADRLMHRGFDSINHYEAMQWVRRHGASDGVVNSPYIQAGYHYGFAFVDGKESAPNAAAGAALRGILRMFLTYEGSIFKHFNGGCGEIFIAPFYDVLKAKGVKFNFFHEITGLVPDEAGTKIEKIHFIRQANLASYKTEYDPMKVFRGRKYWPHEPWFEQLSPARPGAEYPGDFESPSEAGLSEQALTLQEGKDFDLVLCGIPVGALKHISHDLSDVSPRWKAAMDTARTTPTLGVQFWMSQHSTDMGLRDDKGLTTTHELPLSTWCDLSHLIEGELHHPEAAAGNTNWHLSYLCGPFDPEQPGWEKGQVTQTVLEWIDEHIEDVIPGFPGTLDDSFQTEFISYNSRPSDLYVLVPYGSVDHRLRTDETGFDNLFVTGDWTRYGAEFGWVEGAVTAARQCARAISGHEINIYGEVDF